jgi:ABC-2 type transport system ATP-binding protein
MPEILIKNISKTYVSEFKRTRKIAVDNISLSIEKAEIFGIIGVNGAGKSTIIKMIMGFIRPDAGQILVSGKVPLDPDSRSKVGYLPENPYFYDNLTARELLMFSCQASGLDKKESVHRIEILLKKVGLYAEQNQKLRTFSKGMTQRAGICFALVHDPGIIILDEPMSGLDPLGRRMVIDLISDLKKRGKTVLFCSHILNDVERICDRVGIMDGGTLEKIYTKGQILESADTVNNLEEIFLKTIGKN